MTTPTPKAQKFAIGYVHNLSKRTALYANVAYTKQRERRGHQPGQRGVADVAPGYTNTVNSTRRRATGRPRGYGYDFGIRHAF